MAYNTTSKKGRSLTTRNSQVQAVENSPLPDGRLMHFAFLEKNSTFAVQIFLILINTIKQCQQKLDYKDMEKRVMPISTL